MKQRTVDIALIAGLVIVAVVILFTLFSPLPSRESASTPETSEAANPRKAEPAEASGEPAITPVTPGNAESEPTATDETAPSAPEPEPSSAEDGFELSRIGFSFAAGELGACSIPLAPWRHVAVSRDILETYPCGSEVTVILDEAVAGRSSLRAVVGDTMGASASRTVNVYVGPEEPALQYGVQTGRLTP